MPKLSAYAHQEASPADKGARQLAQAGDQREGQEHEPSADQLPSVFAAAASELKGNYQKRLRDHGPRVFRWPDGQLRPEMPPPNPYAAANRQQWAQLVQHCRTHGGDRTLERNGFSLRFGINVDLSDHKAYLQQIGLEPELDDSGRQRGLVEGRPLNPLASPDHCFNTFYKEGAEAVFKDRRGRLL